MEQIGFTLAAAQEVLAQAVPNSDFSRPFEVLLGNGVLGALCVILMFALYKMFTYYSVCQTDRIKDSRESLEALAPLSDALRQMTDIQRQVIENQKQILENQRVGLNQVERMRELLDGRPRRG